MTLPRNNFCPEQVHLQLDQKFYRPVEPAEFPQHHLRYRNHEAASSVGLDDLDAQSWAGHFAKFEPLAGSLPNPLALCYHGHQFGHYNPDLGDGRGFLFAQMRDNNGRLMDLGTKGSGTTPFSRQGDGRLTLKGAVREILATEMLEALGVSTSRSFSVFETGEKLARNDEPSPTRSAVLVRLSHSHIRIGSFQRLAAMDDADGIEMLSRHVARHYYPNTISADAAVGDLLPQLLEAAMLSIADVVGRWLAAGFVHGVLNTDNFNITGESFDYGPWRFLPVFDPRLTAAYFDQTSRYAYGRQSEAALWAVCRLADCFLKLVPKERLEDRLTGFYPAVESRLAHQVQWRLGIRFANSDAGQDMGRDAGLARDFFTAARTSGYGFDQIFHDLYGGTPRARGYDGDIWQPVIECLKDASLVNPSALQHPHFQNRTALSMTIDEVEAIWEPIAADDDWSALTQKVAAMRQMRSALYGQPITVLPTIIDGPLGSL